MDQETKVFLEQMMGQMNSRFDHLEKDLKDFKEETRYSIKSLSNDLSNFKKDMNSFKEETKGSFEVLTDEVARLREDVTDIRDDVKELKTDLRLVKISTIRHASEIEKLKLIK